MSNNAYDDAESAIAKRLGVQHDSIARVVGPGCAFPGAPTDGVDVIRLHEGSLYVNGYHARVVAPKTLEALAADVLGVVLDPVPLELVTPFAEGWIALAGPAWVVGSDTMTTWIETYTGKYVHAGTLISREDDERISRDGP